MKTALGTARVDSRPLTIEAERRRVPGSRFWQRFRRNRLAMASLVFLALLSLAAVGAPIAALGEDPAQVDPTLMYSGPTTAHPLGTDLIGRDVWARLVYAARVSLSVGIVSVSIAVAISLVLGGIAGYYGGTADMVIMRFTDVIMTFPSLILIMTVVATVGPSIYNVMIVIGLLGWTGTARLVRGQILSVREQDFIIAARCVGGSDRRVILAHVLPNVLAPLLVAATFGVSGAILTEAGLSFLGLGVLPPTSSWGNMLNAAQSITVLESYWWLWAPPGTAILVTVLAINFVGDGIRDALDPRTDVRGS